MKTNQTIIRNTAVMTVANLLMRSIAVSFNAYLTSKIGSAGIGLFQLILTVYGLAVTLSCAGVKLASTRVTVEIEAGGKYDLNKSAAMFDFYALFCGFAVCFALIVFSDLIGVKWIADVRSSPVLKVLALSLPCVAMSASLSGYFTAKGIITRYSAVQLIEQCVKIIVAVFILNRIDVYNVKSACMAIAAATTVSEAVSFILSFLLKKVTIPESTKQKAIELKRLLRVAVPDALGTSARSILLTIEHLLIPRGLRKSGTGVKEALSAYGNIHATALPILLYPGAILTSYSLLLIPELAKMNENGDKKAISECIEKNLKRTLLFSVASAFLTAVFAPTISNLIYKTNEAVQYIRILAPLVPIMYMDTVTDGMLKGLDQQIHSMRYNIIDSALCVAMVYFLLPIYSVKGYIFILYASEIINFYLSFGRLIKVCNIRIFKELSILQEDNPKFLRQKRC